MKNVLVQSPLINHRGATGDNQTFIPMWPHFSSTPGAWNKWQVWFTCPAWQAVDKPEKEQADWGAEARLGCQSDKRIRGISFPPTIPHALVLAAESLLSVEKWFSVKALALFQHPRVTSLNIWCDIFLLIAYPFGDCLFPLIKNRLAFKERFGGWTCFGGIAPVTCPLFYWNHHTVLKFFSLDHLFMTTRKSFLRSETSSALFLHKLHKFSGNVEGLMQSADWRTMTDII